MNGMFLFYCDIIQDSVTLMEEKKLYLNPLKMMQRFYDDYGKIKPYGTLDNFTCKYARKKSSDTDKMTKFLNDYDKRQRGRSTITYSDLKNTITNPSSYTPSRYQKNISQNSKRCYFKSTYSQSHPFLTSTHKIEQRQLQQIKSIKTEPMEMLHEEAADSKYRLMNPRESRKSMEEMKNTISKIKNNRKQKMDRVRYNYLVNKCYRNHKLEEICGGVGSRVRAVPLNTQQRIFPTQSLKL